MIHARRTALALATALASQVAASPARADDEAPAIIVYGRPEGYAIDATHTATKTDTALIDVPQTVNVLSREQLDDQGVEQLGDALRYVPGVVLGQGEGHRDQVTLRGQNTTADFFLDGLRDDAQYYRPLYNTERVEVLKGANALIFGRGGGGGVINRVSKAPEFARTRASFSGAVDSFAAWSLAADVGAPLGEGLGSRLAATYEGFDNHRQDFAGHFLGIAPTLGARLGEDTRLTLGYEYAEDERLTDRGVPSRGGRPLAGYDATLFGDAGANRSEVRAHQVRLMIDHAFSSSLSANLRALYGHNDKFYANVYPRAAVSTTGTVEFEGYDSTTRRDSRIVQANLVWRGEALGFGHTLLLGAEAMDQDTDATRGDAFFAGAGGGTVSRITLSLAPRLTFPAIGFTAPTRSSISDVRALSAYAQEQLDIGDHVKLIAGLRLDEFRITSTNRINNFAAQRSDTRWSPRLGLVLKPQASLSLYASYAKSFLPQSGDQFAVLDATTATLAPESFRNLEIGAKWDLTERLALTLAGYRLDRANSRANDPVTGTVVLTGESRTRGIEASLVGQVSDRFQLTLAYALQDGTIRSATLAAPAGRTLAQLPRHQASAWTRYELSNRLGLGLGLVHQSSQLATISNAVRLPAFTRIDAALFYDLSERIALQLNVENLTDADYFPSAHTDNNIATGEPINARITIRVKI